MVFVSIWGSQSRLSENIIFYVVSDIDIGIGQYATKGYILLKRIEIYPKKWE